MNRDEASLAERLFPQLCDGQFHSGSDLAASAGVTRSAIWKAVEQLRQLEAPVQAVTGRGYRLARATQALDARRIATLLADDAPDVQVDVVWSIASTNASLLERGVAEPGRCLALLAEHQSAGRGRRGRSWQAPLGGGLCLSVASSFAELPPDASALSLAVGVCVLRALRRLEIAGAQLKWPNDVLCADGKLGGILIELRAEAGGPAQVVIGIGLNVLLDTATRAAIALAGNQAADLAQLCERPPDRNVLAAAVISECVRGLREFAVTGFASFVSQWLAADALRDQAVTVSGAGDSTVGVARGIDARGALRLQTASGLQSIVSGEVSLRRQS